MEQRFYRMNDITGSESFTEHLLPGVNVLGSESSAE